MRCLLPLSLLSFVLAAVAPFVQAQSPVTYTHNAALSNLSGLGPNGGTALIHYDLVGSPADSPYGSSLQVALDFSPLSNTGNFATTQLSHSGWSLELSWGNEIWLRWSVDSSAIQATDLQNYGTHPPGDFFYLNTLLQNGTLVPQYSMTISNSLPGTPGWSLDSGEITVLSGALTIARMNPLGFAGGVVEGSNAFSFPVLQFIPVELNTTATLDFYYATSNAEPETVAGFARVNPIFISIGFEDLTFVPVPEPSSALLVMASGMLLLFHRRRSSCKREVSPQIMG